jgi:hypothetical protein
LSFFKTNTEEKIMGRGDNRLTPKSKRKRSQRKKKAREKKKRQSAQPRS